MNPGILSLVLMIISLILLGFGWKEPLAAGLSHRALVLFFVAWVPFSHWNIQVDSGWTVNGSAVLLLLAVAAAIWRGRNQMSLYTLISGSLFLASVYFLMRQLDLLDPVLVVIGSSYDLAIALAILAASIFRGTCAQIAGVSISLYLGSLLFHNIHGASQPFVWGDPELQDLWWLTLLAVRVLSELAAYAARALRQRFWAVAMFRRDWRRK